jgi:uracil-DNA glycosylase
VTGEPVFYGRRAAGAPVLAETQRDASESLTDPLVRLARTERLREPHVAPLTALVDELRASGHAAVPYIDPADGGTRARRLFVLQSPTPRALATGFVSRDNPTGTAANLRRLMAEAGIPRADTVLWNAVPWVLARAPRLADIREGAPWLDRLLRLLPELRAVVFLGLDAQKGRRFVNLPPGVRAVASYHPSPNTLAGYPHYRPRIVEAFRAA